MAKKLRDEDLILNIIVNGDSGRKEIQDLTKASKDLSEQNRQLKKDMQQLERQGNKSSDAYKALKTQFESNNLAIDQAKSKIDRLKQGIDINQKSVKELRSEMSRLKTLLNTAVPGTKQFSDLEKELKKVTERYNEVTGRAKDTGSWLSKAANKFNTYFGVISAGLLSIGAGLGIFKNAIDKFSEFDDVVSDVQKTTGLAKQEVLELNDSLKELDTRTSQNDLLGLARVAGKLGISSKEAVLSFVESADKINVALSEDLGGNVEEAINKVGKLVSTFHLAEAGTSEVGIQLQKVGSAINSLGAASTASEEYLVDFTTRLGGIAPVANISIDKVLGFGATLDQLGQSAEVGSSTLNKLIPDLFTNTDKYAKLAGLSVKQFGDILTKDTNQALILLLEKLKGNSGGLAEMAKNLDDLGVDGARSVGILAALANNTDLLKQQQDLANVELQKGTSLTQEFNTKNENAAAKLDKAKKSVSLLVVELGAKLQPTFTASLGLFSSFIKIASTLISFLIEHRKAIITLGSAIAAYNIVAQAQVFLSKQGIVYKTYEIALEKLKIFWTNANTAATAAYNIVLGLLTGNMALARVGVLAFNAALGLNPIAAVIGLVIGLAVVFSNLTHEMSLAEEKQKDLNDINIKAEKETIEQRKSLEKLRDTVKDNTAAIEDRIKALNELRKVIPDHLQHYTDEEILAGKATNAINAYSDAILKNSRLQAAKEKIVEYEKQIIDLTADNGSRDGFYSKNSGIDKFVRESNLKQNQEKISNLNEKINNLISLISSDNDTKATTTPSYTDPFLPKKSTLSNDYLLTQAQKDKNLKNALADNKQKANTAPVFDESKSIETASEKSDKESLKSKKVEEGKTKHLEDQLKKRLEAEQKYREEINKQSQTAIKQENIEHQERLKKAGINENAIAQLREQLKNTTNAKERQEIESKLLAFEQLEKIHQDKINKIDVDAENKFIQEREKASQKEITELKIRQAEELSQIQTFEEAKAYLRGKITDEELNNLKNFSEAQKAIELVQANESIRLQKEKLTELLTDLSKLMNGEGLPDLSLSDAILSDEEKQKLEEKIQEIKSQIADITKTDAKKEIKNTDNKKQFEDAGSNVLGISVGQLVESLKHLDELENKLKLIGLAVQALQQVWSDYNNLVTANEQKQLNLYSKNSEDKKSKLKQQLEAGYIDQTTYNKRVEKIDRDLDRKKSEIEIKQAKRQKAAALANIAINTAAAIISIWAQVPKIDFGISAGLLTAFVAGLGAIQAGIVAATPLPQADGYEDGGYVNVERRQDGRVYNAQKRKARAGFYDEPTILVGESNQMEFVVNGDAVKNPTIRPFLNLIDTAQRNGNISSLNLNKYVSPPRVSGYEYGGYTEYDNRVKENTQNHSEANDNGYSEMLRVLQKLHQKLDNGITAEVALLGKNGFVEKQKQLDKNNAEINL